MGLFKTSKVELSDSGCTKYTKWDREEMDDLHRKVSALYNHLGLDEYDLIPQKKDKKG